MDDGDIELTYAYIDEAGAKGLVRNLTEADDNKFGLMTAILFPAALHDEAVAKFTPGFEKFSAATPEGAKLHFTDAYAPGNEAWASVANEVRDEFIDLFLTMRPMIIYGARRLRLSRTAYDNSESLKLAAKTSSRSDVSVTGANRPSERRVEDDLILSLSLRLPGFGEVLEDNGHRVMIDLLFDQTDKSIATRYEETIERTRHISKSTKTVLGWDRVAKKRVAGNITTEIPNPPFRVDTRYVGAVQVVGKDHPLVLAADLVANHLNNPLRQLDGQAPLHAPSSVRGWALADRVWGVSDDASDDLF